MTEDSPSAPNQRSFSLDSPEAFAALCPPPDPWVWAGGLPREPRAREREPLRAPDIRGTSAPGKAGPARRLGR